MSWTRTVNRERGKPYVTINSTLLLTTGKTYGEMKLHKTDNTYTAIKRYSSQTQKLDG